MGSQPNRTASLNPDASGNSRAGWLRLHHRDQHVPGFVAWYRPLVLGGVANVSQVQLLQPLLTVAERVLPFGQRFDPAVTVITLGVLASVAAPSDAAAAGTRRN